MTIHDAGSMSAQGGWLWTIKDWIDRKWMAMYGSGLRDMAMAKPQGSSKDEAAAVAAAVGAQAVAALAGADMRCARCASQVCITILLGAQPSLSKVTKQSSVTRTDQGHQASQPPFRVHT